MGYVDILWLRTAYGLCRHPMGRWTSVFLWKNMPFWGTSMMSRQSQNILVAASQNLFQNVNDLDYQTTIPTRRHWKYSSKRVKRWKCKNCVAKHVDVYGQMQYVRHMQSCIFDSKLLAKCDHPSQAVPPCFVSKQFQLESSSVPWVSSRKKPLQKNDQCWSTFSSGPLFLAAIPSGKHTKKLQKITILGKVTNFLWPCSMAMLNYKHST